jgi:hypothetical protein
MCRLCHILFFQPRSNGQVQSAYLDLVRHFLCAAMNRLNIIFLDVRLVCAIVRSSFARNVDHELT